MIGRIQVNITALLDLSLIFMSLRAVAYVWIGSWWPAVFMGVFVFLFAGSIAIGGRGLVWVTRIWGVLLCVISIFRFAIAGVFILQPNLSSHGPDIASPTYLVISLGMLIMGFVFIRKARRLIRVH